MNVTLRRLESDIKRVIVTALSEVKDRNLTQNLVTVTDVKLSSDLSYCKVYFSALSGGDKSVARNRTDIAAKRLSEAEGYFKKAISTHVKMRKIPHIEFVPDRSGDTGARIDESLSNIFGDTGDISDTSDITDISDTGGTTDISDTANQKEGDGDEH